VEAQLVEDVAYMHAGRALSNYQALSYLSVRQPVCDQPRHLLLTRTQRARLRVVSRTHASPLLPPRARRTARPGQATHVRTDPLDEFNPFCVELCDESFITLQSRGLHQHHQCPPQLNKRMLRSSQFRTGKERRSAPRDIAAAKEE
jgi:hypothetical protein